MPGRRRETRFLMSPPWSGALHTLEDVVVERIAAKDIWVLSPSPLNRDDGLIFEMANNGATAGVAVRVAESRPVVVEDRLRHRLRLQVVNGSHGIDLPRERAGESDAAGAADDRSTVDHNDSAGGER